MTELGTARGSASSIIAACIVAAGLVGAALIIAHRTASPVSSAVLTARTVAPPIAQESARTQFRAQVLAAPALHSYSDHGVTYTLTDIKVSQVIYTPKDDTFTLLYNWVWQPAMLKDGPTGGAETFNNDGYGHYYSPVGIANIGDTPSTNVTLR